MSKINRPPNFKPCAYNCGKIRCPHLKYRDCTRKEGSTCVYTYCEFTGSSPGKLQECPDIGEVQA